MPTIEEQAQIDFTYWQPPCSKAPGQGNRRRGAGTNRPHQKKHPRPCHPRRTGYQRHQRGERSGIAESYYVAITKAI